MCASMELSPGHPTQPVTDCADDGGCLFKTRALVECFMHPADCATIGRCGPPPRTRMWVMPGFMGVIGDRPVVCSCSLRCLTSGAIGVSPFTRSPMHRVNECILLLS
jgi:hypothetical protein